MRLVRSPTPGWFYSNTNRFLDIFTHILLLGMFHYLQIWSIQEEEISVFVHPNARQTHGIDAMCVSVVREAMNIFIQSRNIEQKSKSSSFILTHKDEILWKYGPPASMVWSQWCRRLFIQITKKNRKLITHPLIVFCHQKLMNWKPLTLPDAEWHFQVLTTPSVHFLVVAADFPEVLAVHGEQTAGHCRTICRTDFRLLTTFFLYAFLLTLRNVDPVEVTVPRETTHLEVSVAVDAVVEVFGIDDIDDWHQNARSWLLNAGQQWFHPFNDALAMRIQKHQHIAFGHTSASQTRTNQTQSAENDIREQWKNENFCRVWRVEKNK